jgi:hypothetical protein
MYIDVVLLPLPVLPRAVSRPVVVLGALALGSTVVAVAARIAVGAAAERGSGPWPGSWTGAHLAAVLDVVAMLGASAAGAGILLAGAALVAAVRAGRSRRLPAVLGTVALALTTGAVLAGLAAAGRTDDGSVAVLGTLRTALAGLAVTCLPALALAALRSRARR